MSLPHEDLLPSTLYTREDVSTEVRRNLHRLWRVHENPSRNPCPQPVSLERAHLPLLQRERYVVAEKSDGVRYTLLLTRAGGREMAFLIDRKLSLYQIPVAANKKLFDGSMFDGELVWVTNGDGTTNQRYLVFDVVTLSGSDEIRNASLIKRIETLRALFDVEGAEITCPSQAHAAAKRGKIICGGNAFGLCFRPKQRFSLSMLDTLVRSLESLPYKSDGYIFTPIDCGSATGTQPTLFKLKSFHSVDIECTVDTKEGSVTARMGKGGGPTTARERVLLSAIEVSVPRHLLTSSASIASTAAATEKEATDAETARHSVRLSRSFCDDLLAAMTRVREEALPDTLATVIVETGIRHEWNPSAEAGVVELSFHSLRADKAHPNAWYTLQRTLCNVLENITIEEILWHVSERGVARACSLQPCG